jgi:hypothetical protein
VIGITSDWQQFSIDLNNLHQLSKSSVKNVELFFEKAAVFADGGTPSGFVYFDQIEFSN